MTTEAEKEYQRKLTAALRPLSKGETLDGKPLDLAGIAVDARAAAREFSQRIAVGQARAVARLHNRRFKG